VIGGRQGNGEITRFFADDNRDPGQRRSYIAAAATISADADGYVLQLRDGALQYRNAAGAFSQVGFSRYDMALELLTGAQEAPGRVEEIPSPVLVQAAIDGGGWRPETLAALAARSVEGLRTIALTLFVAAIAAFPHGRRARRETPIEITVLAVALAERGIATYLPAPGGIPAGPLALLTIAVAILAFRLRALRPAARREAPA
jgi:lipopolysaccharide export system permease protein